MFNLIIPDIICCMGQVIEGKINKYPAYISSKNVLNESLLIEKHPLKLDRKTSQLEIRLSIKQLTSLSRTDIWKNKDINILNQHKL